jgi:hypothetical protein
MLMPLVASGAMAMASNGAAPVSRSAPYNRPHRRATLAFTRRFKKQSAGTFHCINGLGQFHQQEFEKPQRIDLMRQNKQKLARELLAGDAEINLTELSDAELLNLVKLDIHDIGI